MSTETGSELDLRGVLRTLWHRRFVVLGVAVLVTLVAALVSLQRSATYDATAEVLLQPAPEAGATAAADMTNAETQLRVLASRSTRRAVTDELGREPDVSVSLISDSSVATVSATSDSAAGAARAANVYARTYVDVQTSRANENIQQAMERNQAELDELEADLAELERPLEELDDRISQTNDPDLLQELRARRDDLENSISEKRRSILGRQEDTEAQIDELEIARQELAQSGAAVISTAEVPNEPTSPKPVRDTVLAGILGLLLGAAAAFVLERLDDSISDIDELGTLTGSRVLGTIPGSDAIRRQGLVTRDEPGAAASEAFRSLRTSIELFGLTEPVTTIQVTSPRAGEGKTTVAANLAVALAWAGKRTALIDCDLRSPTAHTLFDIPGNRGLTTVLSGACGRDDALFQIPDIEGLEVMGPGRLPPNPAELLDAEPTRDLLRSVAARAEIVILDSPPVIPVTDSQVLGRASDLLLLVAASGTTRRGDLRRSVQLLAPLEVPVRGVLNRAGDATSYGTYPTYPASSATSEIQRSPSPMGHAGSGGPDAEPAKRSGAHDTGSSNGEPARAATLAGRGLHRPATEGPASESAQAEGRRSGGQG